jgi:Reverse transcriptase (RNA-dependent DNA polymerase)
MYVDSKGICFNEMSGTWLEFLANLGVKQGDGASPELFTLFFDRVYPVILEYYKKHNIRGCKRRAYTIASLQLFLLAFADDVVLIAPSPNELQLLLNCFANFCEANDLRINILKTQSMFINCTGQMLVNK